MSISPKSLDFWIANNLNVLFEGRHGVGKTSLIIQAFERAGLKYKVYSCATLDPWVDFIGVPREQKLADGTSYLDLVRPLEFQKDEVEAIFFDEYNRSAKKIRNAVMELMQFKSINGRKFNNLRFIWAAINPEEGDEYDVEKMDAAQADRFHVKAQVPYEPSMDYFSAKYGEKNARSAISWWSALPEAEQLKVSPRRLDYALDYFKLGGNIRDILPKESNCSKLLLSLRVGPVTDTLKSYMVDRKHAEAQVFLQDENSYAASIDWILAHSTHMDFFLPLLPDEKLSCLVGSRSAVLSYALENVVAVPFYKKILKDILKANLNDEAVKTIRKAMQKNSQVKAVLTDTQPAIDLAGPFGQMLTSVRDMITTSTQTYMRKKAYEMLLRYIPSSITFAEAEQTIGVCEILAKSCHVLTLEKMPKFDHIINLCIYAIGQHKNIPADKVMSTLYPNTELLKKIIRSRKLSKKVPCF